MTKILKSDRLAEKIKEGIREKLRKLGYSPKLVSIRMGENPGDMAYEKGINKSAKELDIDVYNHVLDRNVKEDELVELIESLNRDSSVDGIIIFRPLPKHINIDRINLAISPEKDLDCLNPINKSKVYTGNVEGFIPLAPKAAIMLLEEYGYSLEGKDCVIVNHTSVVGKPLSMILLEKEATVTICHDKTVNLMDKTKNADIIFTATGLPEFFDRKFFTEKSVIIDIGVARNKDGRMCGDLNSKDLDGFVAAYSPVPGGIGKLTNLLLIDSLFNYKFKK